MVDDPELTREPLGEDPDDEYLIVLARAAPVEALVSGDQHLLRLRGEIPVLTPRGIRGVTPTPPPLSKRQAARSQAARSSIARVEQEQE